MKRILVLGTALLGLGMFTQASFAADMARPAPRAYPAKAPAYQPYDWSGFYGGLNAGYGWGSSKFTTDGSNTSPEGALLGGTIGYNYQWGQTVFGVESDFDWNDARGSTACTLGAGTCRTKSDWLGTTRLRLGYAADRFMPYITGGAAYGNIKADVPGLGSDSDTKLGWTVGAGAEYAFTPNWSVKAEYLYVDLGKFNCTACGSNVKFNENIVRTGLNYKF